MATVNSILKQFKKAAAKLEALAQQQDKKVERLMDAMNLNLRDQEAAKKEASRARIASSNITKLIEG